MVRPSEMMFSYQDVFGIVTIFGLLIIVTMDYKELQVREKRKIRKNRSLIYSVK